MKTWIDSFNLNLDISVAVTAQTSLTVKVQFLKHRQLMLSQAKSSKPEIVKVSLPVKLS